MNAPQFELCAVVAAMIKLVVLHIHINIHIQYICGTSVCACVCILYKPNQLVKSDDLPVTIAIYL